MRLIIHPQLRLHLLYSCLCSQLCLQGLAFLTRSIHAAQIDNQWSSGVVTTRAQHYVQSFCPQHRDFHQSTYRYLWEDWDSTSHQSISIRMLSF
jgi:hypothetical protein